MESCTLLPPRCFSNCEDVSMSGKLFDLLSTHTYDGEGKVALPKHLHNLPSMIHEEDEFSDEQASLLLAYTLRKSPFCWVLRLPADIVNSLSTSVILLKTHSIILIQTIFTGNYYNNGGLYMNPLFIFSSASMTCSFKLRGAR